MLATRAPGLRSGLLILLFLVGSGSAATGRAEEGAPPAPLLLPPPQVLVEAGTAVDLASQILWSDPERIAVNVDSLYREFTGEQATTDVVELFSRMAELAGFSPGGISPHTG